MSVDNLHESKKKKNDEYYTRYEDIEELLSHVSYREILDGKIIYCNCDDWRFSNFYKYFKENFRNLNLKKLYASHFSSTDISLFKKRSERKRAHLAEYDGRVETVTPLKSNGSFNSSELIPILKESDIVITNPPFSKLRSFFSHIKKYDKKFIMIAPIHCVDYKVISKDIIDGKVFAALNTHIRMLFICNGEEKGVASGFFTNIEKIFSNKKLVTDTVYEEGKYEMFDGYPAINIDKIKDIPNDYKGLMGVPISSFGYSNLDIIDFHNGTVRGKGKFKRIIVKWL